MLFNQAFKMHRFYRISVGAEVSFLPGNYKKIKCKEIDETGKNNVSRLNAGLKLTVSM